jgi:hypothetical protein
MVSVFIMYSNDRRSQLELTIEALKRMPPFESCQKTLIVDGKLKGSFEGFDVLQVPRIDGQFNWSMMWNAGVASAVHDKVWYLDSDRLLPEYYLDHLIETVTDDMFLFTAWHLMVVPGTPIDICFDFLKEKDKHEPGLLLKTNYLGNFEFEPRFQQPHHGSGKNVMSGNTAFTKKTFWRLGGVDPWYRGHGAFADTDFHMTASRGGCSFIDAGCPELHCHHLKIEGDQTIRKIEVGKLSLYNFIYYCHKWEISMSAAENMALKLGISKPRDYVQDKLEEIKSRLVA